MQTQSNPAAAVDLRDMQADHILKTLILSTPPRSFRHACRQLGIPGTNRTEWTKAALALSIDDKRALLAAVR